jgi:hypothetical protein
LIFNIIDGDLYFNINNFQFSVEITLYNHFIETLKTLKKSYSFNKITINYSLYDNNDFDEVEETYYIDELINDFNSSRKARKITKYIYHGTSTQNLKEIMKIGIRPGVKTNWNKIYNYNKYSFFSTNMNDAVFYARKASEITKSFPIILKIDSSNIDFDKIDFDYDFYSTHVCNGHIYYDNMYNCSAYNTMEDQKKTALLTKLKNKLIGATYKKFAYSGSIYPKNIVSLFFGETNKDKIEIETDDIVKFMEMVSFFEDCGYDDSDYFLNFDYYEELRNEISNEE